LYSGSLKQIGIQILGAFFIGAWSAIICLVYFSVMKKMKRFKVGEIYEITGLDALMHGGTSLISGETLRKIDQRQRGEEEDLPSRKQ